jgi:hypothetical protein
MEGGGGVWAVCANGAISFGASPCNCLLVPPKEWPLSFLGRVGGTPVVCECLEFKTLGYSVMKAKLIPYGGESSMNRIYSALFQ